MLVVDLLRFSCCVFNGCFIYNYFNIGLWVSFYFDWLMKCVDVCFWSYKYFIVFIVFVFVIDLDCVENKGYMLRKVWCMVWVYIGVEGYWLFCDVRCRWNYKKV